MDERLRIPVEEAYVLSLGRAVYNFSYLEWVIIYCCDLFDPGYVGGSVSKTAGQIANHFRGVVSRYPDVAIRSSLEPVAEEFYQLVQARNALVHANPATAPDKSQQLYRRSGSFWTKSEIDALADRFAVCAAEANIEFHRWPRS